MQAWLQKMPQKKWACEESLGCKQPPPCSPAPSEEGEDSFETASLPPLPSFHENSDFEDTMQEGQSSIEESMEEEGGQNGGMGDVGDEQTELKGVVKRIISHGSLRTHKRSKSLISH